MVEPNWIRRRPDLSWHIVRQPSYLHPETHFKTMCGRLIEGQPVDFWSEVEGGSEGKSCESCLRIERDRE